jgi:hypothetical protein
LRALLEDRHSARAPVDSQVDSDPTATAEEQADETDAQQR